MEYAYIWKILQLVKRASVFLYMQYHIYYANKPSLFDMSIVANILNIVVNIHLTYLGSVDVRQVSLRSCSEEQLMPCILVKRYLRILQAMVL